MRPVHTERSHHSRDTKLNSRFDIFNLKEMYLPISKLKQVRNPYIDKQRQKGWATAGTARRGRAVRSLPRQLRLQPLLDRPTRVVHNGAQLLETIQLCVGIVLQVSRTVIRHRNGDAIYKYTKQRECSSSYITMRCYRLFRDCIAFLAEL